MLRLSSIPNEYYFGDLPGTIQYKVEPIDITNLDIENNDNDCGYTLCEHSLVNLQRVTPTTQIDIEWKIILMMKKQQDNGDLWLKTALKNNTTGKIALLTSTNNKDNLHRPVKTIDENWFVGHYRMSAPIVFWRELKNRLLYSV